MARVQQQQAATGWDPHHRTQGGTVQVGVRNSHLTSPAQSGQPGAGAQARHAAVSYGGVPGPTYTWTDHGPTSPLRPDPRDDPTPPNLPSLDDAVFRAAGNGAGGRHYARPVQVSRPLHYPVAPDPRAPAATAAGAASRGAAEAEQREPARGRRLWDPMTGEPVTLPPSRQSRPPVGKTVEIADLRARSDLNGQKATVSAHDGQRDDGVVVNTERGEQVYVSARNVRWENEEDPPRPDVGSSVRLKTTKRRPDLEGVSGVVVQHDTEDPEGMAVRISASAEIVQVRVRSIIPVPAPPQRREVQFQDSQYIDSSPRRE